MKITDIKVYITDAFRTNWTFVKVETDEGIHGWGEASLGTQEMALSGCVEDLKRLIVGRNPLEIEKMRFEVYRDIYWKGGPVLMSAISGVEMAMWDIMGKYFNTPVYTFFGGKMRDKVKMYGQELLDNPTYKLLMGIDGSNLEKVVSLYKLTEQEITLLEAKRRGHAVMMIGARRMHVRFDIPEYKFKYFGTAGGR